MSKPGQFCDEIISFLKSANAQSDESIRIREAEYLKHTSGLADAPKIEDLRLEDLAAIMSIRAIPPGSTWKEYYDKTLSKSANLQDERNPWLPSWSVKITDKPHAWYRELVTDDPTEASKMSDSVKAQITEIFRAASPKHKNPEELIGTDPTDNWQFLGEIVDVLVDRAALLFHPTTTDANIDFEFKYSTIIVPMAGLGFDSLRKLAARYKSVDYEWNQIINASDEELRMLVIRCQRLCGYPLSLFRVDVPKLYKLFDELDIKGGPWMEALITLHLLKYCRFSPKYFAEAGADAFIVVYRGQMRKIPIDVIQRGQSLYAPSNVSAMSSVMKAIQIDVGDAKSKTLGSPARRRAVHALNMLTPPDLCRTELNDGRFEIMIPQGVKTRPALMDRAEYRWANHGLEVGPICRLNKETGVVEKDVWIIDEEAMCRSISPELFDEEKYKEWLAAIPDKVTPMRPSEHIRKYIRNVNGLNGHEEGLWDALDTTVLIAANRSALAGCPVGVSARREYPIIVTLPMRGEEEFTTKQGKTNLAVMLARIFVPEIDYMVAPSGNSAPAERAACEDLRKHGTLVLDEFKMTNNEGIFNATRLQALATGGSLVPGMAGENSGSVKLKYPIFLSMKFSNVPPDIRNRQIPIFMDVLTDETRAKDDELLMAFSPLGSNTIRLSTAMWCEKHNFVERVRKLQLHSRPFWRYNGHATVAAEFFNAGDKIAAYLAAAEAHCDMQLSVAQESGTVAALGGAPNFDMVWYFNNCSVQTLEMLYNSQMDKQMTTNEMVKELIEDGGKRDFERELSRFKVSEQSAATRFARRVESLKAGIFRVRTYDGKDKASRMRKFARLYKVNAAGEEIIEAPKAKTLEEQIKNTTDPVHDEAKRAKEVKDTKAAAPSEPAKTEEKKEGTNA